MREYYQKHKMALSKYYRLKRANLKKEIHKLLGVKCVICGYVGLALQIDHVNGGGCKERKIRNIGSSIYYRHVLKKIKAGSKDYQLLCANCNWEKRIRNKEYNCGKYN